MLFKKVDFCTFFNLLKKKKSFLLCYLSLPKPHICEDKTSLPSIPFLSPQPHTYSLTFNSSHQDLQDSEVTHFS